MERFRPSVPYKESLIDTEYHKPLEKIVLPQESIANRIINRYLAIKFLEKALSIALKLKTPKEDYFEDEKANSILSVAAVQAEISEDPIPVIKTAVGLNINSLDVLIYARASRIAACAGNEEMAFELAEKASRHEGGWPLRYTANVLAEKSKDPKLFLNRAAELADTYQKGKDEFAVLRAVNFAETAKDMYLRKRDPKPWLEKAGKTLQQAGEKESWAYTSLANAYASTGDFPTAKSLVNKIILETPEKTQDNRQKALIQIAYHQANQGFFNEAIKTAEESDFRNGLVIILMQKAYAQAKKGEDPTRTLD